MISRKQPGRKRRTRLGKSNEKSLWLGTARLGNIQFIAVSLNELKPPEAAVATISFSSVRLKDLDALYKLGKRTLLGIQ